MHAEWVYDSIENFSLFATYSVYSASSEMTYTVSSGTLDSTIPYSASETLR